MKIEWDELTRHVRYLFFVLIKTLKHVRLKLYSEIFKGHIFYAISKTETTTY